MLHSYLERDELLVRRPGEGDFVLVAVERGPVVALPVREERVRGPEVGRVSVTFLADLRVRGEGLDGDVVAVLLGRGPDEA